MPSSGRRRGEDSRPPQTAPDRPVGSYGARRPGEASGAHAVIGGGAPGAGGAPSSGAVPRQPAGFDSGQVVHSQQRGSGAFAAVPSSGAVPRQPAPRESGTSDPASVVANRAQPSGSVPAISPSGAIPRQPSGAFPRAESARGPTPTSGLRVAAATGSFGTVPTARALRESGTRRAATGSHAALRGPSETGTQLLTSALRTLTTLNRELEQPDADAFTIWARGRIAASDVATIHAEHLPPDRRDELTVVSAGLSDLEVDVRNAVSASFPELDVAIEGMRSRVNADAMLAERSIKLQLHRRTHSLATLEKEPGSAGLQEAIRVRTRGIVEARERFDAREKAWPMGLRLLIARMGDAQAPYSLEAWKRYESRLPTLFASTDVHRIDRVAQLLVALAIGLAVWGGVTDERSALLGGIGFGVILLAFLVSRSNAQRNAAKQAAAVHAHDFRRIEAMEDELRMMERILSDVLLIEDAVPADVRAFVHQLEATNPTRFNVLRQLVERGLV